jgi:hypothetical protein
VWDSFESWTWQVSMGRLWDNIVAKKDTKARKRLSRVKDYHLQAVSTCCEYSGGVLLSQRCRTAEGTFHGRNDRGLLTVQSLLKTAVPSRWPIL